MIDINELRRRALDGDLLAVQELLDRLEAWENIFGHLGSPDEVGNEWHALSDRLEAAESSVAWHQRRWMALQMHQTKMREPERTMVCDILANGELMHPTVAGDRYAVKKTQEESK